MATVDKTWRRHFLPDERFRNICDSILFVGILFYMFSLGLLLAGMLHEEFFEHFLTLLLIGWVIDLLFIIDLFLTAFLYGYTENGNLVTSTTMIFKKYVSKRDQVLLDVLAAFPFDLFAFIPSAGLYLIPLLRMSKILQITKSLRYYEHVERMLSKIDVYISFNVSRFVGMNLLLYQLCHWVGCIWQLVGDASTKIFHSETSWMKVDRKREDTAIEYENRWGTTPYTRSLYWALSSMSSIGYPDILPTNILETVVVICICFLGCQILNAFVGSIASLIGNFNRRKKMYVMKMEKVNQVGSVVHQKHASLYLYLCLSLSRLFAFLQPFAYLYNSSHYAMTIFLNLQVSDLRSFPKNLENRVHEFYNYIWSRWGGIDESATLNELPKSLRDDVMYQVIGHILERIPVFEVSAFFFLLFLLSSIFCYSKLFSPSLPPSLPFSLPPFISLSLFLSHTHTSLFVILTSCHRYVHKGVFF